MVPKAKAPPVCTVVTPVANQVPAFIHACLSNAYVAKNYYSAISGSADHCLIVCGSLAALLQASHLGNRSTVDRNQSASIKPQSGKNYVGSSYIVSEFPVSPAGGTPRGPSTVSTRLHHVATTQQRGNGLPQQHTLPNVGNPYTRLGNSPLRFPCIL